MYMVFMPSPAVYDLYDDNDISELFPSVHPEARGGRLACALIRFLQQDGFYDMESENFPIFPIRSQEKT